MYVLAVLFLSISSQDVSTQPFSYQGKTVNNVIAELTGERDIVLATGGGAVLDSENRARLVSRGFVIYLEAPIDLLVARTARDRKRPLMQEADDPRARVIELLEHRDPLYRQTADMIVKTDRRSSRIVVKEILRRLAEL